MSEKREPQKKKNKQTNKPTNRPNSHLLRDTLVDNAVHGLVLAQHLALVVHLLRRPGCEKASIQRKKDRKVEMPEPVPFELVPVSHEAIVAAAQALHTALSQPHVIEMRQSLPARQKRGETTRTKNNQPNRKRPS
jgi:hypothetical protein